MCLNAQKLTNLLNFYTWAPKCDIRIFILMLKNALLFQKFHHTMWAVHIAILVLKLNSMRAFRGNEYQSQEPINI